MKAKSSPISSLFENSSSCHDSLRGPKIMLSCALQSPQERVRTVETHEFEVHGLLVVPLGAVPPDLHQPARSLRFQRDGDELSL